MARWLLIRHGETDWNAEGRIQGHSDTPLNAEGRRQARLLGTRLARVELTAVYSSDSSRAHDTAKAAASGRDVPFTTRKELRERSYGEWEGLTGPEIEAGYPEGFARWRVGPASFKPPGGESRSEVAARVRSLIAWLRAEHGEDETIALVGHGGSLATLAKELLGIPHESRFNLFIGNTGVSSLRVSTAGASLITWNDTSHWEGPGV